MTEIDEENILIMFTSDQKIATASNHAFKVDFTDAGLFADISEFDCNITFTGD